MEVSGQLHAPNEMPLRNLNHCNIKVKVKIKGKVVPVL
jgi:hypothetical protein